MELTDQELLDLATDGDGTAFATLVGRYEIPLRGYFRRKRVDEVDAGDLLQETFSRVYRYAASYDPAKRLGSWIFTIASNLFKDRVSKNHRMAAHERSVDPSTLTGSATGVYGAPEASAIQNEAQREIVEALRGLSSPHRAVFMLKHYYGLRYQDIAKIMGCSVGTVKSRMHHACLKMQAPLRSQGHGGDR